MVWPMYVLQTSMYLTVFSFLKPQVPDFLSFVILSKMVLLTVLTVVRLSVASQSPREPSPVLSSSIAASWRSCSRLGPFPRGPRPPCSAPIQPAGGTTWGDRCAPPSVSGTISASVLCTPSTLPAAGTTVHIPSIRTRSVGTANVMPVLGA